MQGKVVGNSIVIMDSFALPVQGTETRVNAANEANEYMVTYIQEGEKVRLDHMLQQSCVTDFCAPRSLVRIGQTTRESDRMVSFPSGLWVLVVWYRRRHTNEQSAIPRSFRGRRCMSGIVLSSHLYLTPVFCSHYIPIDRPQPDDFSGKGRHWCFPYLPKRLYPSNVFCV